MASSGCDSLSPYDSDGPVVDQSSSRVVFDSYDYDTFAGFVGLWYATGPTAACIEVGGLTKWDGEPSVPVKYTTHSIEFKVYINGVLTVLNSGLERLYVSESNKGNPLSVSDGCVWNGKVETGDQIEVQITHWWVTGTGPNGIGIARSLEIEAL
jgi:hypothetical protein